MLRGKITLRHGMMRKSVNILNSVIIVSIVLIVSLIVGALAGYALSRFRIKHAEIIMLAILACTMLPSESVIMPLYLITSKSG